MKIYIHSKNKPLFRHGNPATEEYAWFSPNYKVALSYGQFKTIKKERPNLVNNKQINAYFARRGNRNIRNNINRHTKRNFSKNLKLVNLRNKNTMNYLLNQLRPNLKSRLKANNYITYKGNTVTRKSNFNKDVIIANLITHLKKNYGFNINGFYNKGNKLNEEIVVFNSKMPRRLNARRVRMNVIKKAGPNSFNTWKQSKLQQLPLPPPAPVPKNEPKRNIYFYKPKQNNPKKLKVEKRKNPLLSFGNSNNENNNYKKIRIL